MILRLYILGIVLLGVVLGIASIKRNRELRARSVTLLVLLSIFCLIMWAGSLFFILLITAILLVGVYELGSQYDLSILPVLLGVGGLFVALVSLPDSLLYVLPVFVALSVSAFTLKVEIVRQKTFFALFAAGFLVLCAASLPALYRLRFESIPVMVVLLQCNDVFGYLLGKKFGRRKIFKHLSPGKSLEGYLFSLLGILVGLVILQTIIPVLRGKSFVQQGILLIYFFVFGNLGDLLFSSIKRKLGIKDFSSLLPGHGGVLDRFDSFLFTAPGMYVMVLYGVL